ncbi:DUF883 family protein [Herbaspirillum sp.]|uniref:DUF883 family protein n=1 Tax=Herbaspirillum sp. TaxID=1890675 RepID=UPI001B2224B8|nr:DUF883 family protein [Herbaspirillum sp.]MBO9538676.1 DUF883 family protein [Herbaspirillum sp.]
MPANNIKTVRNDVRALLQQAQDLFAEAAAATGKNADELRAKGQQVLDQALNTAQEAQSTMLQTGRQIVTTTDDYVQSNPWRAIAISSSIGLLVGLAIGRCADRN